ncbi:hypothetical protein BX600DRAFT_401982 [Xylariales sp. PMI_506]|nr:hypothetical protein BX600DRAFT_401982 [Xylariales sp. PMI_506]
MHFHSFWQGVLALGIVALGRVAAVELTVNAQEMLDESMSFLDQIYDPAAGYLSYFYYPLAAGRHETRSSMWYAAGLLQRNQGDDLDHAVTIITNIIEKQAKNVSAQWYGDYATYPEQPTVGSPAYPAVIYNSWDPNWRGFVGTTLIVIYEEFKEILPSNVQDLILESLYNNTIGDSYRVGGVDGDNLYPAYSNPAIMRAVKAGWTGRALNNSNMTAAGEAYATEIVDLFNLNNTLSEFNSATYMGVSIFALTLWAKYMPDDSVMGQNGKRMIQEIWESAGELYNANLKNLAGPWDRAYGYDTNSYLAIFSLFIWSLVGKDGAPIGTHPWAMTHANDAEIMPLIAVLAPFHDSLVPSAAAAKFRSFTGEHTYQTAAYSPPWDLAPRNVTAWLAANVTIGAQSFRETVVGGPAINPAQWNPAVAQWARADGSVGYLSLSASESALAAEVAPNTLSLTWPDGNDTSRFTFIVSTNPRLGSRDIAGLEDLEGVDIHVSGTVNPDPAISFCGLLGGACSAINGFEFWNFTYTMPPGSTEVPSISLSINLS